MQVERGAAGVRRAAAVVAAVVTALADTPRDARRCLHAALVAALVQNIMQVRLVVSADYITSCRSTL